MSIAWSAFTPWHALAGGTLIGAAASLLVLANGRVAGVSGILGGALRTRGRAGWQIAFLAGLLLSPLLLHAFLPGVGLPSDSATAPTHPALSWGRLLIAGFLVGVGTHLANGCTSGHGVCGLARLSKRSLWATLIFVGAGLATVFVARHVLGGAA